jgi:hypothetical protein
VLFTERGRRLRGELEPRLNELLGEARKLQDTVMRAKDSVSQSWEQIEGFVGQMGEQGAPWAGSPGGREH